MSRLLRTAVSILAAGVLAAACGDSTGPDDGPSPFIVHITTPFPDDGAVLVVLYGPLPAGVNVVAGGAGLVVHSVRIADTLRIAVFGTITSGPMVRLEVPNGAVIPQIFARVEDAASRDNVQRGAVSGYALRLEQRY